MVGNVGANLRVCLKQARGTKNSPRGTKFGHYTILKQVRGTKNSPRGTKFGHYRTSNQPMTWY